MPEPTRIKNMSVEDYLKFEDSSTMRNEYVRGQIFAMSGATEAHNVICGNLHAALHAILRGTGYRVYMTSMKVNVEPADCFYYPDIMVTCEPFESKSVFKSSPTLIVEVLSPSTEQIDRREKLVAYLQLSSLREYVLVHQNKAMIELYRRMLDDQWELEMLKLADEFCLESVGDNPLQITVSAVYEGLDLPFVVKEIEEETEEETDEEYEFV